MPLVQQEDTLTLNVKIPRKLHDEIDEVRKMAKDKGVVYDVSPAVVKALEKDLAAAKKELSGKKKSASERPTE